MSLCCTCLPPTSIVGCLLDSIVPSTCTCFTSFPCQSKTTAHLHRQCSKMMVLCCTCSQRTSIVSCLLEIPINPVYRVDKAYSYNVKLSSGCSLLTVHQFQRIWSTRTSKRRALVFVVHSYKGVTVFHAHLIDTVVNFNVLYC